MTGTRSRRHNSSRGTVFYTPRDRNAGKDLPVRFPDPPCRPATRRPLQIQITRFPEGFVPHDLRPQPAPPEPKKPSRARVELGKLASREGAKRALGSVFSSLSSNTSVASSSAASSSRSSSPASRPPSFIAASSDPASLYSRRSGLGVPGLEDPAMSRTSVETAVGSLLTNTSNNAPISATNNADEIEEKPVVARDGVACYFILAEQTIFLTGLDQESRGDRSSPAGTSLLRGKLQLRVTKTAKIKSVTIKFTGKSKTYWPEGIPPSRKEDYQAESFRNHVIPFFNALWENADDGYGAMCNYALRGNKSATASVTSLSTTATDRPSTPSTTGSVFSLPLIGRTNRSSTMLSAKETKRLSLQNNQSRSFNKSEPQQHGPTPQQKGYKLFHPGVYDYNFELMIPHNSPESTDLPMASVVWQLEVLVERAGAFRANLQGFQELPIIRSPTVDSLEMTEPIAISRTWEDQLHYEIMISGKAFPLGARIPIAFKLTPLSKVHIHKIKVYVSENLEYHTTDHSCTRKEPARKLLLFEKLAGQPLAKEYANSEIMFTRGGEPSAEARARSRQYAQWLRVNHGDNTPLPEPSDNILGDLDLGLENLWGETELETMIQLPTCEIMEKDKTKRLHPNTTWKNVSIHHWIKIVLRISRRDIASDDPKKRRHFEISIDSPFTLLSCRATAQNLALPAYSGADSSNVGRQHICGCPNAPVSRVSPTSSTGEIPTLTSLSMEGNIDAFPETAEVFVPPDLTRPPPAHLSTNAAAGVQRPIHMLRNPSYNPPAFDAEEPPPPIATPPPLYDNIIGTPSHDGLADYFARLGEVYDDDETDDDDATRASTRGRVNVANPRTPGGRIARSMDIDRNFMFNPDTFNNTLGQENRAASESRGYV